MTDQEYIDWVNQDPRSVEQGNGYKYIKKSILQKELLELYKGHIKWEMLRETVSRNGLWGVGILHFKHPVSSEWLYLSGTASIPLIKSMRLSYPSLEAQVFKNAVKKIGPRFGQLLNIEQEDEEPEDDALPEEENNRSDDGWVKMIQDCKTLEELVGYKDRLPSKLMPEYMKQVRKLT